MFIYMKMPIHKIFINVHVILAGFFLIPALMFSITGALYTFKITGTQKSTNWEFSHSATDVGALSELTALAENQLTEKKMSFPTGGASIKKNTSSWSFEWTGSDKDFLIEPLPAENMYKATLKEATWYRYFVQLHKAKGGYLFKVLAASLAGSFAMLFLSGVLMAIRSPDLKFKLFYSFIIGTLFFILAAFIS